jgi:GTPase
LPVFTYCVFKIAILLHGIVLAYLAYIAYLCTMSFTVAIVGRPNVGKSTIFNRLIEKQKAIVDDISGVTRDRQYAIAEWSGRTFNLIDTGGFVGNSDDVFETEIRKQVRIALDEANVIIFVVDVATGITSLDDDMAHLLRQTTKPVLVMVNKVDNGERALLANEFYALGFEQLFFVSSLSGSGTGELLDAIIAHMPPDVVIEDNNDLPKIAIVGQPNVGKSSMLNALVGEERTIVSDVSGTTRDTIHTRYNKFGKDFLLVDTAGIRKKKNVHEDLEFYSVIRAIKAIDEADVCVIMIDAKEGFTAQDVNIFSLAARKGKGVVIVVNKWDLVQEKETMTSVAMEKAIKLKVAPFVDIPIIFTSVHEKQRIFKVIDTALEVVEARTQRIPTSKLNDIMLKEIEHFPPPFHRGTSIKIKFVSQLPVVVPSFTFYSNFPDAINGSYTNFLENKLRHHFNFKGVPVRVFYRKK